MLVEIFACHAADPFIDQTAGRFRSRRHSAHRGRRAGGALAEAICAQAQARRADPGADTPGAKSTRRGNSRGFRNLLDPSEGAAQPTLLLTCGVYPARSRARRSTCRKRDEREREAGRRVTKQCPTRVSLTPCKP